MEIESVPTACYRILNDFIRVGKRLISQNQLRKIKKKQYYDLVDKINEKIQSFKSKHFLFEKEGNSKVNCEFLYLVEVDNTNKILNTTVINIEEAISLEKLFERSLFTSKYQDELYDLIYKVKKAVALDTLLFFQARDEYKNIVEAINKKYDEQNDRFRQIYNFWEEEYPPEVGTKVFFTSHDPDQKELEEGVIESFSHLGSEVIIKKADGELTNRPCSEIEWENCFWASNLHNALETLARGVIPKCWRENKIDFY